MIIIGPNRYVTGKIVRSIAVSDCLCDECQENKAEVAFMGENDSFGGEVHELCQPCCDRMSESVVEGLDSDSCELCGASGPEAWLGYHRDITESGGPQYVWCSACAAANRTSLDV